MKDDGGLEERWTRPPQGLDVTRASSARIYDLMLGGKDHYAVDREVAARVLELAPQVRDAVRENRRFLQRAVHYLAGPAGIRQFVDIGTGLPTVGNVHEIARALRPDAHVVYVDNDPIVLVHGRALLADNDGTVVIEGDARDPADILAHPQLERMIDFNEPVAVLFVALLHFLTDEEDPGSVVAAFREVMAPGSYVVLSHATAGRYHESSHQAAQVYRESATELTLREPEQVLEFFDGFELVPPGLVPAAKWRPELPCHYRQNRRSPLAPVLAGVGRKK